MDKEQWLRVKEVMPHHNLLLTAVVRALDNETFLAEALFFPEFSRYGVNLSMGGLGQAGIELTHLKHWPLPSAICCSPPMPTIAVFLNFTTM